MEFLSYASLAFSSVALNIIFLLVYLKVPEFLQSYLIKRMEVNITEKIEHEKMRFNEKITESQLDHEKRLNELNLQFQKQQQELEHNFTMRLDTFKKTYEVLPVMYEKIVEAESYYKMNYSGNRLNNDTYKEHQELKYFITLNKFYIDEEIYIKAKECEEGINDLITCKYEARKFEGENVEANAKKLSNIEKSLEDNIKIIERLIQEKMR